MITKTCLHCGAEFQAESPSAKFCSHLHRYAYHNSRRKERLKNLGALNEDEPETRNPDHETRNPQPATRNPELKAMITQNHSFEPLTALLINRLEAEIKDLKEANKEKDKKIEELAEKDKQNLLAKLTTDKEHEAALAELRNSINEKPKGLGGFIQNNQAFAEKALDALGPKFGEALGKLVEKFSGPSSPHAEAITNWMLQLPNDTMRNNFFKMLETMIALGPEKMNDKMAEIIRSLMTSGETKVLTEKVAGETYYE